MSQLSHHLAVGLTVLLLLCHVLGQPLLVPTQLVVPLYLQKLHLLFAPVPLPLQPHELMCAKKMRTKDKLLTLNSKSYTCQKNPAAFISEADTESRSRSN